MKQRTEKNLDFCILVHLLTLLFITLQYNNFQVESRKYAPKILEYMIIEKAAAEVPSGAEKIKEARSWNYDLRWNDLMQWDVQHSSCWNSGDLSKYFNSSIHKKWDICRLTASYLNEKLPPTKHHFKTATCCYIKCALHWFGWVNDDFSYNEARGENISKDLLHGLPTNFFTSLMKEYRKCSHLYKHPFDEWCSENLEFARCHIQAFNNVCDAQLDKRLPFPRPPAEWTKLEQKSRHVRKITESELTVDAQMTHNSSTDPDTLEPLEDRSLIQIQRSRREVIHDSHSHSHSNPNHRISKRRAKHHWLTTVHFCQDLCMSACSLNQDLYTR